MNRKPEFLEKVTVSQFSKSTKRSRSGGQYGNLRAVEKTPNNTPDVAYTVVGRKIFNEGISEYVGYEEGYSFTITGRKTLYAVARKIGELLYAATEDMEALK